MKLDAVDGLSQGDVGVSGFKGEPGLKGERVRREAS